MISQIRPESTMQLPTTVFADGSPRLTMIGGKSSRPGKLEGGGYLFELKIGVRVFKWDKENTDKLKAILKESEEIVAV